MADVNELLKKAEDLEDKYEQHFKTKIPSRIVGWWNPVNITAYPDELARGLKVMEQDINNAIKNDTPIEEIPEEIWKNVIF